MTTINVRADKGLKDAAKKILGEMGLDMSGAVKLFLQQVVITKGIPFPLRTANGFTHEDEARMIVDKRKMKKDIKDGKAKLFSSADELINDLLN